MIDRKHSPVPLTEEHYHIKDLISTQEKRSEDRTHYQEVEKQRDGKQKMVAEFKDVESLDFWCEYCSRDFMARAKKQVDSWDGIAYYKTKHPCGTWAIRHITDRGRDKYFFLSANIRKDRREQENEMVQSFETGYNLLYGKK